MATPLRRAYPCLIQLGRYQILRKIAEGGMARVYAARVAGASGFEKLVAIKQMLPAVGARPDMRRMFLDEARVAANIRSAHVVSTFDLGEADDGSPYIVMDLVVGCTVSALIRGFAKQAQQVPINVAVEVLRQAAVGLHDAHGATSARGTPLQLVHRDVSPQNILVGVDGNARLTDFGVAHALERLTQTQGMRLKGKVGYCSPEQAQGEPLDARSDLFGLGIVAWELLCGRRLYKRPSAAEALHAVVTEAAPDPRTIRPEIPESVAYAILQCLDKEPQHRFLNALEFAEAIRVGMPAPRVDEIQAVVHQAAGEQIETLVGEIRAALDDFPQAEPTRVEAPAPQDDVIARHTLGTLTLAALPSSFGATGRHRMRTSAHGMNLDPATFGAVTVPGAKQAMPQAASAPADGGMHTPPPAHAAPHASQLSNTAPASRRLWMVGALVLVMLLSAMVGVGFVLSAGSEDEAATAANAPTVSPLALGASPAEPTPSPEPRVAPPLATGTENDEEPAAAQPDPEPTRVIRERRGADTGRTQMQASQMQTAAMQTAAMQTAAMQTVQLENVQMQTVRVQGLQMQNAQGRWHVSVVDYGHNSSNTIRSQQFLSTRARRVLSDCWSALPNPRRVSVPYELNYRRVGGSNRANSSYPPGRLRDDEFDCIRAMIDAGPSGVYTGTLHVMVRPG